jgi:CRISPR-associated autoregulator DevR family
MPIRSISICGEVFLDLHALNNEGAEGNNLMTRMVDIVDHQGNLHSVNAVSGDMLKHIQAEHLYHYSLENALPLCNACKKFDANRICADEEFTKDPEFSKETPDSVILGAALQKCTLDDIEGILITSEIGKARSIARKSCVEFGWAVGIPDQTRTESYFHVKYVPEGRGKGSGEGENLGQNIFHRPASSGVYAVVVNLDLLRVSRNDISLEYAADATNRAARAKGLIVSVMNTFLKLNGAHRNTQLPHLLEFRGAIITSTSSLPAPSLSALNKNYREQLEETCEQLNRLGNPPALTVRKFDNLSEFTGQMVDLASCGDLAE